MIPLGRNLTALSVGIVLLTVVATAGTTVPPPGSIGTGDQIRGIADDVPPLRVQWTPPIEQYRDELREDGHATISAGVWTFEVEVQPIPGVEDVPVVRFAPNATGLGQHQVSQPLGAMAFHGSVVGHDNSSVYLFLNDGYFAGFIDTGSFRLEFETRGEPGRPMFEYYETPTQSGMDIGKDEPAAGIGLLSHAGPDRRVYQFASWSFTTNSVSWTNEIANIANRASIVYFQQIGFNLWDSELDTITWNAPWQQSTDPTTLLNNFRSGKCENSSFNDVPGVLCHFWDWKDWVGTTYGKTPHDWQCGNPESATTHAPSTNAFPTHGSLSDVEKTVIYAHETGHKFTAVHDNTLFGTNFNIMWESNPYGTETEQYSTSSINRIKGCNLNDFHLFNPWV